MSFVSANLEAFGPAAQDLTGIGSAIRSASSAAAVSTTQVAAAAQDEVSAAISGAFGSYAQQYQALIGQAGLFHEQLVQTLNIGAEAYKATEAANAGVGLTLDQIAIGSAEQLERDEAKLALALQALPQSSSEDLIAFQRDLDVSEAALWRDVIDERQKLLRAVAAKF